MKSKKYFMSLFILFFAILCVAGAGKVQAASSYEGITYLSQGSKKVGGVTFSYKENKNGQFLYAKKNGKKTLIAQSDKNTSLSDNIVTNGKTVYYVKHVKKNGEWKEWKVCRVSASGSSKKKLFTCSGSVTLVGYYNGRLYYKTGSGSVNNLYRYTIKSKKKTKIVKNLFGSEVPWMYGKYICFRAGTNNAARTMKTYNASTKKTKTLTKRMDYSATLGSKLYFSEFATDADMEKRDNDKSGGYSVNIKCFSPKTGKTTTLVKSLKVYGYGVSEIKTDSVSYYDKNGNLQTKKY